MEDEKTRYKAVILYKMTGNKGATATQIGISGETLRRWMKEDWWKEYENEIRLQSRSALSGKLQGLVDRAIKQVEDRLENGDWIYDQKLGKMIRKPVNAHVANQVLKDSINHTVLIDKLKENDKDAQTKEVIQDTLQKLMVEFAKFSKMRLIEGEKIDHAVHEERKEGLQEGAGLGASPSGSPEGPEREARGSSSYDEGGEGSQGGQPPSGPQSPVVEGGEYLGQEPEGGVDAHQRVVSPDGEGGHFFRPT